jgi:hypothetical protein
MKLNRISTLLSDVATLCNATPCSMDADTASSTPRINSSGGIKRREHSYARLHGTKLFICSLTLSASTLQHKYEPHNLRKGREKDAMRKAHFKHKWGYGT